MINHFELLQQVIPGARELVHVFNGYTATTPEELLPLVRSDPNVRTISQHRWGYIPMVDIETTNEHNNLTDSEQMTSSTVANLSDLSNVLHKRIRQANIGYNLAYVSEAQQYPPREYHYLDNAGNLVDVYILDTGVDVSHPDSRGRAFTLDNYVAAEGTTDFNGHGTHVAGIVGGTKYGVSKKCNIISIKIANSKGMPSVHGAMLAIEDVVERHKRRQSETGPFSGSVINMSFEVASEVGFRNAVRSACAAGIIMVAAAGNSNDDLASSNRYPAKYPQVITVAASNDLYKKLPSSSYGAAVDIIAPGAGIESDWKSGGTMTVGGTSQAAPHVAGIIAVWMSFEGIISPDQAKQLLTANADNNILGGFPSNTVNKLSNNGYQKSPPYAMVEKK
ncbi:hypothetical protein KCU73_g7342, partial [Aureobasidium melanogenum]